MGHIHLRWPSILRQNGAKGRNHHEALSLTGFLFLTLANVGRAETPFEQEILLEEHLGHAWAETLLHKRFSVPKQGQLSAGQVALFRDEKPVPMQLDNIEVYPDGSVRAADVWFRTDLTANGVRRFVLRATKRAPKALKTDLRLSHGGNIIELSNAFTAVRLPAGRWGAFRHTGTPIPLPSDSLAARAAAKEAGTPEQAGMLPAGQAAFSGAAAKDAGTPVTGSDSGKRPGSDVHTLQSVSDQTAVASRLAKHLGIENPENHLPGPLLGVRLRSGQWTAGTHLTEKESFEFEIPLIQPIPEVSAKEFLGYETEILAQGPLFCRVRVTCRFGGHGEYGVEVTLRSQEPLVRIDERYRNAGAVVYDLGANLKPTFGVYLSNGIKAGQGNLPIDYRNPCPVALFIGWDGYFRKIAPALGLMGDPSGECLGLVSTDSDWLPFPYNQAIHVLTAPENRLLAKASLTSGQRHWAFYVGKTADFPVPDHDFYKWWWQNVALPLDKVANWDLAWPGMMEIEFPHTFFSKEELPDIRKRLQADPVISAFVQLHKSRQPRSLTDAATVAFFSGDPADMAALKEAFLKDNYVEQLAKAFLDEPGYFADNYRNYMQITDELLTRYVGTELVLGSDLLTPEQRRRFLTLIAFSVRLMDNLMFWPPNYPFNPHKDEFYPVYVQGTPNQKTCYITGRGISACMIPNHPRFQDVMKRVLTEFDRVVSDAVAPSGAHLESPFYSSRDTIRFGPFWTAVTRTGVKAPEVETWLPRIKSCFQYMSDMLTPREPRMGGRRVYHPVGRSSSGVIDPTLMIAAEPFGRDDLAFKRRMRWCWEQQGKPSPDIMGNTGGRDMSLTLLAFSRLSGVEPCDAPPLKSVRYEGMGAIFRSQVGTDFESNILFRHDPFAWNLYEANNGAVYFYGKGAPLLPRFGGYWMGQQGQPNLMSIPFGNRVVFEKGKSPEWTDALGNMTDFSSLGDLADFASGVTRDGHWRRNVLFAKDLDRDDPVYLLVRDDVNRPGSASALHWWVMSKQVQPDGLEKPGVVPVKGTDEAWLANLGKNWREAPKLDGQFHHFSGQCGVDIDLFIAVPEKPAIVTDAVGVGPGLSYCVNRQLYEYQQLVRIEQPEGKGYLTLLVPRWPGSEAPKLGTIADGAGAAATWKDREDRLFLASQKASFKDEVVDFEGQAGFARIGGSTPLRLMVANGRISAKGITLSAAKHAALRFDGKAITVYSSAETDSVDIALPRDLQGVSVQFRRK
jgi:hypothetical protein